VSPRENIVSLYRRTGYEFAPVHLDLCPSLRREFEELKGAGDAALGEFLGYPRGFSTEDAPGPELPERGPVDWSRYHADLKPGAEVDLWGVAREPGSEAAFHLRHMRHPMERVESLEEMQGYPFPEFERARTDHMAPAVEAIHDRGLAAVGGMACTIWETAWYVRGMPQLMMDMMSGDLKAAWLLDRITGLSCVRAAAFARAGVDMLHLGDDVGMQSRMLMAPGMWREWLKPRLARVVAAARAERPEVIVKYHSCGFIEPVVPDLIEVGVDVLNPVQPESMDFARLHAEFGDRLSFNGTLGTQTTMPFGSPEDVREVVFRNLRLAGEKGGLMVEPTHMLEPEVPWENIQAYVDACREFTTAGV
jgi:uroporphyrinogen decarboxylase